MLEALGGTCWWQGDIPAMGARYNEALEIWTKLGDEHEIANAAYNAAFQFSVPAGAAAEADNDPDRLGLRLIEQALAIYRRLGDRQGEANAAVGSRQLCTTSAGCPDLGSRSSGRRSRSSERSAT